MLPAIHLDPSSNAPLYRQLSDAIKELIGVGRLERGGRLPATRELAGILGLNRTTVSAAYALLESEGLVRGHVGRGSFVLGETRPPGAGLNWEQLLPALAPSAPAAPDGISFSSSCPAEDLFPMEAFRRSCEEVLAGTDASAVLQLGSPSG